MTTSQKESETYQQMLQEVETIIQSISSDIELDEMVTKVERGYGLITAMRSRLGEAKGKIEKLASQFDAN